MISGARSCDNTFVSVVSDLPNSTNLQCSKIGYLRSRIALLQNSIADESVLTLTTFAMHLDQVMQLRQVRH